MRKLAASCLLLSVLLALSLSVPVLASMDLEEAANHLDNVNAHIDREIEKALHLEQIALSTGDLDRIEEIIFNLVYKTSNLVENALEWAARMEIPVEHYDITVFIGGRDILVDPIHVLW